MSIRNIFLKITDIIKYFIPIDFLIKISNQEDIFPFYHLVTDKIPIHIKHLYKPRNIRTFEKDLDFFLKHYNILDVEDLIKPKDKIQKNKPGFFLTFDDGLREIHDIIAPLLVKKGIPALCFLNSAFTDNKDMFYRYKVSIILEFFYNKISNSQKTLLKNELNLSSKESISNKMLSLDFLDIELINKVANILEIDFNQYLAENQPYMTSLQISALRHQGFHFGAHSIDHPKYELLDLKEQLRQTLVSLSWVRQNLKSKNDMFAFPFSDVGVSNDFFTKLHLESQGCLTFGTSGFKRKEFPLHFQRIAMETQSYGVETIIKNEYLYYQVKNIFGIPKMKRNNFLK